MTQYTEQELMALHGFGPKALKILKDVLFEKGLNLKVTEPIACDLLHPKGVKEKPLEVIDGYTIKYYANGSTMWFKGKMREDQPDGYWEWYRPDGTLKRSGYFQNENPVDEWITYNQNGAQYKTTQRG